VRTITTCTAMATMLSAVRSQRYFKFSNTSLFVKLLVGYAGLLHS